PFSTTMSTRGKFVCGKSDSGTRVIPTMPPTASSAKTTTTDRHCVSTTRPMFMSGAHDLHRLKPVLHRALGTRPQRDKLQPGLQRAFGTSFLRDRLQPVLHWPPAAPLSSRPAVRNCPR